MTTFKLLPVLFCLGLASAACTPTARWGDRAFYSPAHRGYVISAVAPDDRPNEGADTIVLVDPLGGDKLTCQEDVERFIGAHAKTRSDDVTRENRALASAIGLFPMTAVGAMGLYVGIAGAAYSVGFAMLSVPDSWGRYNEGLEAFEKRKWRASRQKLEIALAGDMAIARTTRALFQIGRVYQELDEDELATRSYVGFVKRSFVRAEAEYMRAEAYLEQHDVELPECKSQEDVEVVWP